MEGLPDCLLEGELRKCTLVLRNSGASALRGIRVVTGGPDVHLAPGNAELASPAVESVLAGTFLHAPSLKDIGSTAQWAMRKTVALFGIMRPSGCKAQCTCIAGQC